MTTESAPNGGSLSRRRLLRTGLGLGIGAGVIAFLGTILDYLWVRDAGGLGGVVEVGPVVNYPPGSKTHVPDGRFWLVNLTEAEGGPGFLALWEKCSHLNCKVPWNPDIERRDPRTDRTQKGWFFCPCHDGTFDAAGVRTFGPPPRSMDRMYATYNKKSGYIEVNTGRRFKGTPDNPKFALRVDA